MGTAGSASGGAGAGTGYEWAGSLTTSVPPYQGTGDAATDATSSDANVPPDADATPPHAEAGASDATLEAGRIILGISVAPPDAGSEQ